MLHVGKIEKYTKINIYHKDILLFLFSLILYLFCLRLFLNKKSRLILFP